MSQSEKGQSRSSHRETDTATERLCHACKRYKPFSEYSKAKTGYRGLSGDCKPCQREKNYARRLRQFYGLSPADYEDMLEWQGGKCAICGKKPGKHRLNVDHSHESHLVRGLLCGDCNSVLGMYRDRVEIFRAFAEYLVNPPAVDALDREHHLSQAEQAAHTHARKRRPFGNRMRRY